MQRIDLSTPLTIRSAFLFPLQSPQARKEILWGALLLCVPFVGWLLNMGHRIAMTRRMQQGLPAWPAWYDYRLLLYHGMITFLGMAEYHAPAVICGLAAWWFQWPALWFVAACLWLVATAAIPGYMTHYCHSLDVRDVFNPIRALRRVAEAGPDYWRAWLIALTALCCSLLGLLAVGVGFLISSVWFWQVAGFSFATVFTKRVTIPGPAELTAAADHDGRQGSRERDAMNTAIETVSAGAMQRGLYNRPIFSAAIFADQRASLHIRSRVS